MDAARLAFLTSHRAHDARALLRRWQSAVRQARWHHRPLATLNGWPVMAVESPAAQQSPGGLYLSAGVHGDEPAPPWALLEWFETHARRLRDRPVTIVPCFNPHGFAANTRSDHLGEDLNRQFHRHDHPLITPWRDWLGTRQFALGLCLHEDYDARGTYCYELSRRHAPHLGAQFLAASDPIIPRENRPRIEGRRAVDGVIRRSTPPRDLPGHAEAMALHFHHASHTLTFETPSEFCLHDRVHAHRLILEAAQLEMNW